MGFASPYVTGQRQCQWAQKLVDLLLSDGGEKEEAFFKVVFGVRSIYSLHMIITIHSLASPSISERICCVLFLLSVDIDFRSISPELQTEKLGHASDGSRENHTERAGQGSNRNEKA
jgi:hypothetical protein